MNELKLKPCPFCGGKGEFRNFQVCEDAVDSYVQCESCCARTEGIEAAFSEKDYAVKEWNTRFIPEPQKEAEFREDLENYAKKMQSEYEQFARCGEFHAADKACTKMEVFKFVLDNFNSIFTAETKEDEND